ncbi:hypothetical protein R0J90_18230, partial [Micrococcus sp. SIMBA_144]
PPCTCEKSQYIKREKEIISLYENLGLIKFEDTLLDRQIEDEILRTADGLYRCYKYFGTIEVYHMDSSRFSKPFITCYLNNYTNKKI